VTWSAIGECLRNTVLGFLAGDRRIRSEMELARSCLVVDELTVSAVERP
jgi:hypothetical protein